jgi:hypothetical protein
MQQVSTAALGRAVAQAVGTKAPMGSDQLNDNQRKAVMYFFARLKMISPQQYDLQMPDEKTEQMVKKEFTPHVMNFNFEQIDKGLDLFHQLRQDGDPDYKFLDLDKVVGLIKNGGTKVGDVARAGIYKPFRKDRAIESEKHKTRRQRAGESALSDMKAMFNL